MRSAKHYIVLGVALLALAFLLVQAGKCQENTTGQGAPPECKVVGEAPYWDGSKWVCSSLPLLVSDGGVIAPLTTRGSGLPKVGWGLVIEDDVIRLDYKLLVAICFFSAALGALISELVVFRLCR